MLLVAVYIIVILSEEIFYYFYIINIFYKFLSNLIKTDKTLYLPYFTNNETICQKNKTP